MATALKPIKGETQVENVPQNVTEQLDVPARQLSARDSEQLLHSLDNPPAPSSRLLEAAARYRTAGQGK